MRRAFFLPFFFIAIAAWCPTSFAQRQQAIGPGITPLNATGVLNGVDLSVSGTTGTLSVGVPGGPEMDIFTNNNSLAASVPAVSTAASSQGNIVFNSSSTVFGAIGATHPAGPFLLNLSGGNNGTAVNFQGPVFATTLNVSGTGAVNFNSGSTNITATNFAADGTISLAPNTTLIGALTTTAGANTGTLGLGGASVLNGAVGGAVGLKAINVVGGNNNAGVSATITGATNAYTFNLGTNTLNIGGALTIANGGAGGVINTTLASPSLFGNIRPVGATNLGATLGLNVSVPSTAVIPVGAPFNIVQTQTGTLQSGTNGSILAITSTNPLYAFSQVPPTGGTPAGLVSIVTTRIPLLVPIVVPPVVTPPVTPPVVITPPGVSPIVVPPIVVPPITTPVVVPPTQPIAAPVVIPIITLLPTLAPTSTLTPVVAAINSLTNPADVINAVAQLAPSAPDLAAPLVTFQGAREFQNLWLSRMDEVMCGQISQPVDPTTRPDQTNSTCRENEPRSGLWAKGFGYFGSQDAQNAFLGYDARIYGTMIGYDVPVNPETRVGLGFGYSRNIIDGKTLTANTDSDNYQGTAYLTHEHGPWFIQGDASFGWNDYSGSRSISLPGISLTPKANYSGLNYTTFMTTGYHFFNQGFTITPLASLQYTHVDLDRYTETGAGDVDLNVNSQSYDFVESGLGVKVARPFAYNDGTYVPEMHFKWFRELVNPTFENTAAFTAAGSPFFTTPGMKAGDNTFDLGVGLQLLSCDCTAGNWSVEAVYDHEWRSRWSGSPPVSSGEIDKDGAIVTRRIQDGRCEPWIADGRGNDACAASELLCRRCVEAFPEAA